MDFAEAEGNALGRLGIRQRDASIVAKNYGTPTPTALASCAVAACWISATAIAAALVLGLADYLVRLSDPGLRIMSTAALVVAVVWAAHRWWYLPQRQRLVPLVVARRVEARFPQLRDSLASAVEFLRQSETDETAGSAQLRRLVIAEAHNAIESIPMDDVIERGPLRKAAASVVVAVVAASICVALDAGAVRTALARLAAPLGAAQWPRQHHLVFRDVPTRLAAGQAFEVALVDTAGKLPDDVRIQFGVAHNGGRKVTSEPMMRAGDTMIARGKMSGNRSRSAPPAATTMRWPGIG